MILKVFPLGPVATNCWLVASGKETIVIDAPKGCSGKIATAASGIRILYVINTHGHWDHITENAQMKEKFSAEIACHRLDEDRLKTPQRMHVPFEILPSKADVHLDEGSRLKVGGLSFLILHTPGHTPGSICVYEPEQKIIFTGDTLFAGTHGRTDFPGGNAEKMKESLGRLAKLPEDTKVYPGHGEATTIGGERWLRGM